MRQNSQRSEALTTNNIEQTTQQQNSQKRQTSTRTCNTAEQTIEQQHSQRSQALKRNRFAAPNKTSKKMSQDASKIDEAFDILKNVATKTKSEEICDNCTDYGKHVASKMRKYSERARCVAQYHINNILFQADMGHFDEYSNSTRMTYTPTAPVETFCAPSSRASSASIISTTPIPTPSPQELESTTYTIVTSPANTALSVNEENYQNPSQEDNQMSAGNYLRTWNILEM